MSEIVENINEQNSAQNKGEAALPTEAVVDVTPNNVDAAIKAVPEAVEITSAATENTGGSGPKDGVDQTSASPKVDTKKTPAKRTPSKRLSFIERAQKESEELVKNMGGSLEIEGGRKTRSSTRGSATTSPAVSTPPPAKKARASPASGTSTPTRPRGRGRKLEVADEATEGELNQPTPSKKKSPVKGKKGAAKEVDKAEEVVEKDDQNKSEEEKQEPVAVAESNLLADEHKETPAAVSGQTEDETPEVDKTDAAALDPVVEETESQVLAADSQPTEKPVTKEPEHENKNIAAEVVLEISESAKSDSPMDTDIELIENKCQDKRQEVPKPTLEPMEIDSSPENDVVEIIEELAAVVEQPTQPSESEQPTTAINNIEQHPAAIVANNLCEKPTAVADAVVANVSESITGDVNNAANKAENDLCEPKIATSPPISANSDNSATTPQTCN